MRHMMILNKKGDELSNISFQVPLTIPLSNSFYQNLNDIYSFKELLYNEGIADIEGLPIVKPDNCGNSVLPNSY